jgi:phage repressor protein C with HTH and peptisase S24 domain
MSTLAERLAAALAGPPRLKLVDLARACNVRPPSVNAWTSGKTKALEGANLLAASEFLGVNPWWLATGEGPMRPGPEADQWAERRRMEASQPSWPFAMVPEETVRALSQADRNRLEGAMALTLAQFTAGVKMTPESSASRLDNAASIIRAASTQAANDPAYVAIRRVSIKISAGVAGYSVDSQDDGDGGQVFLPREWLARNGFRADALFATWCRGMSMHPRVNEGDIIVVNTQDTRHRNHEVYAINHEGEFTLKRLEKKLGHWWLKSDNPDQANFAPVMCNDRTITLGRVVHMQTDHL